METLINIDGKKIAEIQGENEVSEQKNIKNKISIWECVCPKCGNNRDFELPQGVIPKYCSRCGSEADYREVAGYETGENKKTPQDVLDQGERLMYKDVCEIKETSSVDEVNDLLNDQKNKWKLLTIVPHKKNRLFIIGRF